MSQHIGNHHHHHQKTQNSYTNIWISNDVYSYIYMTAPNVYIQKYRPTGPCHIWVQQNRLTSLNSTYTSHTIKGPLRHPQLLLPQAEVAHPYLPQAVVVEHLQDHPAQVAGVHSS
jgi:hypothetical protein